MAAARDNTAFESMTNGVSASLGVKGTLATWRLSTITRGQHG